MLESESPSEEVIGPIVKSTIGILHSARKCQDTVKRVVITGSSTAIAWLPSEPTVFDESTYNVAAVDAVEKGVADPMLIYSAAKTTAEQRKRFAETVQPACLGLKTLVRRMDFHEGE